MAFKKICKTKDVSVGNSKEYNLSKHDILVVNVNGQFHCLSARCTHAGAPLASGIIRGEELQCPWHGNLFRVTDGSLVFAGWGRRNHLRFTRARSEVNIYLLRFQRINQKSDYCLKFHRIMVVSSPMIFV